MFTKLKYKKLERYEKKLAKETKQKLLSLSTKLETNISKEIIYNDAKLEFYSYLKKLFLTNNVLAKNDAIDALKTFNVTADIIKRVNALFDFIEKIDYNNHDYTKEEIFEFMEDFFETSNLIYIQKTAHLLSKEDKISGLKYKIIKLKYLSQIKKIKNNFNNNIKIETNDIVKATEYYEILKGDDKEKLAKQYHAYCINIPYIYELIEYGNTIKKDDFAQLHQIISKINKLILKLDDEKEKIYPLLLEMIDNDEEKLNLNLMIGYESIHKKDIKQAIKVYSLISTHFKNLDDSKKIFYKGIIVRYLANIKKLAKKN